MAATAARKTNWFAIWVSAGVVVVLAIVAALVIWMNSASSAPGEAPKGQGIDSSTGAIAFGTGSGTMDTYIDFMCPICNTFEQTYGEEIGSLVDDGTITLNVHPISILDRASQGTQYSTRAASAMYAVAVADHDNALAFMQAMYASQPEEGSAGLTDEKIIEIAEGAGVSMTADLEKDIKGGRYMDYVTSITEKTPVAPGSQGIGTPTVAINGTVIANSDLPTDPTQLPGLFQ